MGWMGNEQRDRVGNLELPGLWVWAQCGSMPRECKLSTRSTLGTHRI